MARRCAIVSVLSGRSIISPHETGLCEMTNRPKRQRELHLGLMFWAGGTHPAGWRMPSSKADAAFDIEFLQYVTQLAEKAKFDFLFLGDRLATDPGLQATNPAQMSRLEPFISGASLAAATSHIGIVVTANPTYYDPFTVARLFASLDHLSKGRASWNIVTGADSIAAANFSRDSHWETDKRYDWADEFVDVVKGLWDSFEDDAFVRDPVRGTYVDPTKVHKLNHKGQNFAVEGPLNVARPVQGHPVILHAGTSERSRELGARDADVIFAGQGTIGAAKAYYADMKARAVKYGRDELDFSILPGLTPIVAPTTEEAVVIYDSLNGFLVLDKEDNNAQEVRFGGLGRNALRNLTRVSSILGVDVRGSDHEAAVPRHVAEQASPEGQALIAEATRRTRRTLEGETPLLFKDLIYTTISSGAVVVGNPGEVADFIELWFREKAADGFNIFPPYVPESVEAFVDLVVPELQKRGFYRADYSGYTFRDHLGLARPENRFAAKDAATSSKVA
ncbi:NtaA/DmoA family FMN-dependent monooxygenase [Rhizobium puerariae]|uniref:NtaA/DmoA family FMN-dependent monooxygenase n=1 Tax=Rhizobium puerariae TaxID=1585791 RepID=A0ABV6AMR1_9HYPH